MSSLHVLINKRNWHYWVNCEVIDYVHQHSLQNNQTTILKVGKLDVHRSKFNSPTNWARVAWRRFESHWIPICALQVFKMTCNFCVVYLLVHEFTLISWHRVSSENARNVRCKSITDSRCFLLNDFKMGLIKRDLNSIHELIWNEVMVW